jgi:hypothetical protein
LAAASLLNVALFDSWKMILDPARSASLGYRPTSEACWAAVTVCALAFLIGALIAIVMGPAPSRVVRVVTDLALLGSSLLIVNLMRPSALRLLPSVDTWVRQHGGGFLRVFALLLILLSLRWRRGLAHGYYRLLLIVSPFLLATVGRATVLALTTNFAALDRTVPSLGLDEQRPGVRVVVLVFDELDFNYAFASRPRSLVLPAFDSLRRHAFFATDAHAPAWVTRLSIPSYLVGERVDSILAFGPDEMLLRVAGDTIPRSLSRAPGLFDDAAELGAPSAAVGYRIPYCRLGFARLLERCTWRPISRGGVQDGPLGFPRAVLQQVLALVLIGNNVAQVDRIRYLDDAGVHAASDPALRVAFVHLPVPHLPPVWDEPRRRFTYLRFGTAGYFDNLALADHELERILSATQRAGLQDRTVFVVTSDHPARFGPIAGIAPAATVPFLVRFPDGGGVEWTRRFETVSLRSLVRALLSEEIRDAAELAAWAAARQAAR